MRRSFLLTTAALAGGLALGCGDQPSITDSDPNLSPSFQAEISRFEQPLLVFFGQADPPLAVHLGVSLEDFPAFCAGADPELVADAMIVTHPTKQGGISEHVLITAKELNALVWQVDVGEPGVDICQLEPLAVGTVHITINDNEGQFFETAPGGNAFSIRFVGTVTDPETGQRYHLQGASQIVVLPDGTFKFPPVPFLSLTPIGG
jgi:hypothetical protein